MRRFLFARESKQDYSRFMNPKILICALFAPLTGLSAAAPEAENAPATAKASFSAAVIEKNMTEFNTAEVEITDKIKALKDKSKASALYRQMPASGPYIDRILTEVVKNPNDAMSKKGLTWSLSKCRTRDQLGEIADLFKAHYLDDPIINLYARSLSRGFSEDQAKALQTLHDQTNREDTRYFCQYYLAVNLQNRTKYNRRLSPEAKQAYLDKAFAILTKLNENPRVAEVSKSLASRISAVIFEKNNLSVGSQAPEIIGDDHTGTIFKLSDYRGKVVQLTFWGSWCGPCMAMVPHERKLVEKWQDRPFVMIGVNSDNPTKLKQLVEKRTVTWRSFNNQQKDFKISDRWNVSAWPSLYIIDHKGVIRHRGLRGEAMEKALDALIQEAEAASKS